MAEAKTNLLSSNKNKLSNGMKSRKSVLLIGCLVLLAVGGFSVSRWFGKDTKLVYFTLPASQGTITESAPATGTLEPVRSAELSFTNVEVIKSLNAKLGQKVIAGQVLAEQNATELAAKLRQAQSDLVQAEAQLQQSASASNNALKTLKRQEELYRAGAIPLVDLETATADYDKSKVDVATARAQVETSKGNLTIARNNMNNAKLLAPFDGIVSEVTGEVGQKNGGGSDQTSVVTVISEELQLKALVNEVDIGKVKVGQDAEFTSTAYPNETFQGKVVNISLQATTVSNVQYFQVLISCPDPKRLLRAGMSTTVNVIVARQTNVLTVSSTAFTFAESYLRSQRSATASQGSTPSSSNGGGKTRVRGFSGGNRPTNNQKLVMVLQGDKPVPRPVVVGLNDGQNTEIVSGLNQGDKVIIGTNQYSQTTSTGSGGNSGQSSGRDSRRMIFGPGGPPPN